MAAINSKISQFPGANDPRPALATIDLSALLRDGDPTREIRRYIEQLQEFARETAAAHAVVDEERSRLEAEIERLRKDNDILRDESREARRDRDVLAEQTAHSGAQSADLKQKLESVERARLDAVRQRDEALKFYKESQGQIEEVMRIKDEAVKQRDAFARQRDVAKKEREELATRLPQLEAQLADARKIATESNREETQKQMVAIRQARDAAATQCAELKLRISQLEDDVYITSYDRDHAQQAAAKAQEEASLLRKKLEDAAAESNQRGEAAQDEAEELRKALEALKHKNSTLTESIDALTTELQQARANSEATASSAEGSVAELRAELDKLARERESEMEEYGTKLGELRAAHENELQLARQQYQNAMSERDAARVRAQERESEMEEFRSQLAESKLVADRLSAELSSITAQMESMRGDRLRAEAAEKALEEARNSLTASQEQVEHIIRDRDNVREHLTGQIAAIESKLKEQHAEMESLKTQAGKALDHVRAHEELVREHEEHRLQMIEVSARLATAHGEIKELSASLAEARLRVKNAGRAADGNSQALENADPAMRNALTAMRRTFHDYLRQPADFNLINELQNHAQHLADRARETGQMTVQRLSGVLGALTRELYETPEQATPPTMRAVGQSIEFIATLLKEADLDKRVKLADVKAFAVDDDQTVLDAVCESLQAAGLDAATTESAGAALAELATNNYDLIILDVNLPELDGLELCSHVREMPNHANTPVIFITGHASLENRVQFSLRGGSELLIKPFNLLELALRSLSLIVRTRLKTA